MAVCRWRFFLSIFLALLVLLSIEDRADAHAYSATYSTLEFYKSKTMIVRAAKLPAAAADYTFTDRTAISEWAQSAVASASASHVIDGYSDGSFKPQANATRAEAVTVIMKSIKK